MAKGNAKNTALNTVEVGELVEMPHGGALRNGGTHKGGHGAIPSAIREHCRGSFAERVPILEAVADGRPLPFSKTVDGETVSGEISASIKERVQAIDVLAKYGGVDKLALTADEQPEHELTPERILEVWKAVQAVKSIERFEKLLTAGVNGSG